MRPAVQLTGQAENNDDRLFFEIIATKARTEMGKQVKEIRADRGIGGNIDFIVIYDDMTAQKIIFTAEELQHWNLEPKMFIDKLFAKMKSGTGLHASVAELEQEYTSDDYKADVLFDELKKEVENEVKPNAKKAAGKTKKTG